MTATGTGTGAGVVMRRPQRIEGYLPIRDYAAIGDRHTVALVGLDGSVDWLCLPSFDAPFVLGALLDADRGGRFALAPVAPYEARRGYVPETNVLQTTFSTAQGSVRVTDALTLSGDERPVRELARRVEGLTGEVTLAWRVAPRFGHTERPARIDRRDGTLVARRDGDAVVVGAWDAGEPVVADGAIGGRFTVEQGGRALLTLSAASIAEASLPVPRRDQVEERLEHTIDWWRRWCAQRTYDGPWREAVLRSGLVLKMLVDAPSGAIVGAPTSGLPEALGGSRNWDYRFCWLRDASFTVDALMRLGDEREAGRFFSWLVGATREHHPRLWPFYRLDGSADIAQHELSALAGYRGSRPVLQGNGAVSQRQLGNYGDLLQAATLYVDHGGELPAEAAGRLAEIADHVCDAWTERDSSIWELGTYLHYTVSKMLCWVALDRAGKLAGQGRIPGDHVERWRSTAQRIRGFVEERCWSPERQSYMRSADSDELDCGVLVGVFMDYGAQDDERLHRTVDRLGEELGAGPLLYRYTGMDSTEGTFLACAFWRVQALARLGRLEEARRDMDQLVALGNDVGLYSEEMGATGHEMLGNFPQALTHLALVNAAVTYVEASERR